MTDWRTVQFSLGGNDRYNDCTFVSCCNLLDLKAALAGKPFTIGEAEAELFYAREAGFRADNPASDKGAILADVIQYWCDKGWPADPVCKPSGFEKIDTTFLWADQRLMAVSKALREFDGLPCWSMLPSDGNGDPDFTDAALNRDTTEAHATLIVDAGPEGLTLITWAYSVVVSWPWWTKFGRNIYGIALP